MNIIIVGAGKIGSYLTSQLAEENHKVLVIEKNKDVLDRLLSLNDVMGILGDGTDPRILKEAEVSQCDIFVALALEDDTNIIASVLAKSMGAKYTIARAREPKYTNDLDFMRSCIGVDNFVNPEYYAAKEIQRTLKYPDAHSVEAFLRGKVNMIQIEIDKDSGMLNKSLEELNQSGHLDGALVCIAKYHDHIFIPGGDHVLKEGEFIHIAGDRETLYRIYRSEIEKEHTIKNVMVIGASRIGYYLSKLLLERNFEVTIIEIDREKAYRVQEALPRAVVINTDGADPDILAEERISNYDAVISLTGIDQENIIISLVARKLGIRKIMTKVDNMKLLKLTGILDMDDTITSKRAASDFVIRLVRSKESIKGFSIKNLYRLEDERVEAIEFNVVEDSYVIGKKLKDLKTKDNTLVSYIQHDPHGKVSVANGDSVIQLGDRVLVMTTHKNFAEIDDILE
ncbi:MAG: Trk system potassium transporter TrkA [Peptoniphilus sp.]|nr:Trk system potassium transporter TrkA [Peptoniphilus sp.]MDD7363852.1 Trk system potassium transporter TrkA [Bacillota bacterium]MDY6044309.1 Trk system potassium transporter TrkA [Peptoniphilus sp.]